MYVEPTINGLTHTHTHARGLFSEELPYRFLPLADVLLCEAVLISEHQLMLFEYLLPELGPAALQPLHLA